MSTIPPNIDPHPTHAADIHLTPDGKFLYVSNRDLPNNGTDSIAIFSVDQKSGELKKIGGKLLHILKQKTFFSGHEPAGGAVPRRFTILNSGVNMLVGNQDTGNIVSFQIDRNSGKLTKSGDFKCPAPVCLNIVDF